jgi:hypothetical protein
MNTFTWEVDGHSVLFRLGGKYYRPFGQPDLHAWAWAVEGGYRAAISDGHLVKLSSPRPFPSPQGALEYVAAYYRRKAA